MKPIVFLCHASEDKEGVRRLYKRLNRDGFCPWLDAEDILPGQDWEREIRNAIRNAGAVIVCLSDNSISKRGFVQKEIAFALDVAQELPEDDIYLIPVKLSACPIPDRLKRWQAVNLLDRGGYAKLVDALNSCNEIQWLISRVTSAVDAFNSDPTRSGLNAACLASRDLYNSVSDLLARDSQKYPPSSLRIQILEATAAALYSAEHAEDIESTKQYIESIKTRLQLLRKMFTEGPESISEELDQLARTF